MSEDAPEGANQAIEDDLDSGGDPPSSPIFRREALLTRADRRVDSSSRLERIHIGSERIDVGAVKIHIHGDLVHRYGERDREVGSYKRMTRWEEGGRISPGRHWQKWMKVGSLFRETAGGGYKIHAEFSAESMVGGGFKHTITGAFMRLAAWIDFMAWIAWTELDVVRVEIAAMMIRSHIGYAHAVGVPGMLGLADRR